LIGEKEQALAEAKVQTLIASGHLVTDLSALDENDSEIHAGWKAQFTVTEITE
jgi:hypothetical protein